MKPFASTSLGFLLSALVASTGCAHIVATSAEPMQVTSNPPGATVLVNGQRIGLTPVNVLVPRKVAPDIQVLMDGYRADTCRIHQSAGTGYIIGDVAFCFILFPVGCVSFVDANGAWNSLDQPTCHIDLQPVVEIERPKPPEAAR